MSEPIVAVMMLRNEDLWLEQALKNIRGFVDDVVMILDNKSVDGTYDIAKKSGAKIKYVDDLLKTHDLIQTYLEWDWGWLFGVDGDELYDPVGLRKVRKDIDSGMFDSSFLVHASWLHTFCMTDGVARGYLAPPSWHPSKLFHISCVKSWPSDGRHVVFDSKALALKEGVTRYDNRYIDAGWDESPFRCVHVRFMARSTREESATLGARPAPLDEAKGRKLNHRQVYRQGPVVSKDVACFIR